MRAILSSSILSLGLLVACVPAAQLQESAPKADVPRPAGAGAQHSGAHHSGLQSSEAPSYEAQPPEPHQVGEPPSEAPPVPTSATSTYTPRLVTTLGIAGDRSIVVAHANHGIRRAIVYLHGMCSEVSPARVWIPEALRYGTFVALRADVPCGDRPGFKWPKDPVLIMKRLERALDEVRSARGGELDLNEIVLIGYSQGAHRAELLSAAFPSRFPLLVLGGPPEAAHPENFSGAKRIAVFGGEREDYSHMAEGQRLLAEKKIASRFFVFPGAPHGSFGPEGQTRMREVLAWLLAEQE